MIPARYAASRFPGKLMQDLHGKTVITRTYEATLSTGLFEEVYVVTDSDVIREEITKNGGNVIMSQKQHESGSDRIAEAVQNVDADIVINVRGDQLFLYHPGYGRFTCAAKGACSLPGCTLIFDRIVPVLQRAVIRGFVSLPHAQHTFRSLRFGYTGGAQQALLERSGQRPFRNYPSAIAARAAVTRSLNARITAGKSLLIGKASNSLYSSISSRYASWFMFSLSVQFLKLWSQTR